MKLSHCAFIASAYLGLGLVASATFAQTPAAIENPTMTPDLSLTGQAWALADKAYTAYNSKDFRQADALATQALTIEPLAPQLYLLRIYALQQMGQPQQAQDVARQAIARGLRRKEFDQLADVVKPAANQDKKPPNITSPTKVDKAGTNQTLAPVNRSGSAASERAYQKAYPLARQAYAEYAQHNYGHAASLAEQAFRISPHQQGWAQLWIDALAANDQPEEVNQAIDQAIALGAPDRQALLQKRIDIAKRQDQAQRQAQTAQATELARKAYQAYEQKQFQEAIVFARQAVAIAPQNSNLQSLLTTSLAAGDKPQNNEALTRLNTAIKETPGNADLLLQRAYLYQRLGQPQKATADFTAARNTGNAPPSSVIDAGFAAAAAGDKRLGVSLLKEGIDLADAGKIDLGAEQKLNLRQNTANLEREWGAYASVGYRGARAATSGLGGSPAAALGDATFSTTELFWRPAQWLNSSTQVFELYGRLSNTLHDEGTQVGESFDNCGNRLPADSYSSTSGFPSTLGSLGARYTPDTSLGFTFGVERRFNIGSRARLGSATPLDCSTGIPGKEYQTDRSDGDWLAYITYAYYKGTELRSDKPSWLRIEGYAQAGYLWSNTSARFRNSGASSFNKTGNISRDYQFVSGELRVGQSIRVDSISPKLILYPHLVAAADWQNENSRASIDGVGRFALQGNGRSWSMGIGPGLGVRYWFRSDKYASEHSYADLTIQYRMNVGGGAEDRSRGLFMNLTMSW